MEVRLPKDARVPGRRASDPWLDGLPPHLPVPRWLVADFPAICLLPGDPARVDLAAGVLDEFAIVGQRREFRLGIGRVGDTRIAVCSTGIGGPSTEIAVVELARLNATTVIRVGGMGALEPSIAPGTICSVVRAALEGGSARWYATATGARDHVAADPGVTRALAAAARALPVDLRPVRVVSTDSYYLGQGRQVAGYGPLAARRLQRLMSANVDGVDMETGTVLAVGAALGVRAGALLVAHGNRASDEWLEDYEPAQMRMLAVAAGAAPRLSGRGPAPARDQAGGSVGGSLGGPVAGARHGDPVSSTG